MPEPRQRFWQIHLSTLIVLTSVAGLLGYLNLRLLEPLDGGALATLLRPLSRKEVLVYGYLLSAAVSLSLLVLVYVGWEQLIRRRGDQ